MIDTIKTLCSYTACAIHQKDCKLKIESEQTFFTIAKENGLIPMIYETIDHESISDGFKKHLKKHFYAFVAHDTQSLAYIAQVDDILNKHEIKHIFLKGSILKNLYPKTYYRGMGDIDILIEDQDLQKVHEIFKKHNIILKHASEQHDSFLINHQMPIEIHPKLYKDFNKKYEALFTDPWIYANKLKDYRYQFDPSFEIVYLLYHLAKHLDSSGIGLRSLLDIGIYLNAHQDNIHKEKLLSYLKTADMVKFFTQMVYLNIKYFDFKNLDEFLFDDLLSDQGYDRIIEFFSTSGIHGRGSSHNPFSTRVASNQMKNRSKSRVFISILFPNFKSMAGMFPVIKKIPILLPFLWVFRWLKLILFKTNSTIKKMFQFKAAKPNDQIKDIYRDLGM
jgi:hypothetical protein